MKPGEHPDFYRIAPPPGASRESTIVLDRDGRFWHDGDRVDHPALEQALRTWIAIHPDDGRLMLTNGYDWTYFRAEGAAFFVDSLAIASGLDGGDPHTPAAGAVTLHLFDGTEEPLDPATLSLDGDGAVHARVKGGRFDARFSRHAQTQLAPLLIRGEPPTVLVQGREVIIPTMKEEPRPG